MFRKESLYSDQEKIYEICSKLTTKAPEQRQWRRSSDLLLFSNIFHILFKCFYWWLWASKCWLGRIKKKSQSTGTVQVWETLEVEKNVDWRKDLLTNFENSILCFYFLRYDKCKFPAIFSKCSFHFYEQLDYG